MKRSTTFVGALIASLSLSATALAAPSVDTMLTAGYDSDEMQLVFNTSDTYDPDSPSSANSTNSLDCALDGEFTYTVDESGERVATLTTDGEDVVFAPKVDDGELAPATYGSPEAAECGLLVVKVEPKKDSEDPAEDEERREVNHGTVVSTFVHTIREAGFKGAGCIVRFVAQSDWGKDDIEADAGEDLAEVLTTDAGTVTLESFDAACNKAKKTDEPSGETDDGPGKSDEANRGKDKNKDKGPDWKASGEHPGKGNGRNK